MADSPDTLRLNRYLALAGLGSRRACESLIVNGEVEVNGKITTNLATQIGPRDVVSVNGREVSASRFQTIVLHKPPGVHCTRSDPKGRPTVYTLLAPQHRKLHYVGRLDADSEGLLVFTNDGDLTQQLTHPSHKVEKEYIVTLDKPCRSERVAELLAGIPLEEGLAKAAAIHVISPRRMVIVLEQGLNRQIRRMFTHMGYEVERLIRVRIGNLTLPDLKMGKWRVLEPRDIARLLEPPPGSRKSPATRQASSGPPGDAGRNGGDP